MKLTSHLKTLWVVAIAVLCLYCLKSVTLTYIGATIPGLDVAAKIAASLWHPATDDGLFSLHIRAFNKQYENGYCFIIPAVRDNLCVFRPAKYLFLIDDNLIEKLKENKVEVPENLLKTTVDLVNKDLIMCSYDYLYRCKNFVWGCFLLPLFALIIKIYEDAWVLNTATRGRKNEYSPDDFIYSTMTSFPSFCLFIQIVICCLPTCCHRKKRDFSLQSKLWRKVGKECIENNALLLFTGRRNKKPSLSF
ncbi:uncharacterized protein LOC132732930 [Ruditapes philippinarum]|uniref:uncharacterized protein LOC132732930 n=1 Tax=Ruditapes philippinarum TaxID=129788 RepID=UPI00295B892B|nr:uncharacterized protein LOC132732930 [Ruditapes philippinarum]